MKIFKKISVLLLTCIITVGAVFVGDKSHAATSYKKQLSLGKIYKYDLDGDKKLDTIKLKRDGSNLYLIVNDVSKKLSSSYNPENDENMPLGDCIVRIYDLNKNDKTLDIVSMEIAEDNFNTTRIIKFDNKTCKVDQTYKDAKLKSYNPNTGIVTLEEFEYGRFSSFKKAIGCFGIYDKVRVDKYKLYNRCLADTSNTTKNHKYVASKNLTAYTNTTESKKSFTVKKGAKLNITGLYLYNTENKKYIKVKSTSGKYGYIKVGSSMLFTKNSCLWWR